MTSVSLDVSMPGLKVTMRSCRAANMDSKPRYFYAQGWSVIATMRTPREDILPRSERMRVLPLDVTRAESIAAAVETSGPIDVLVNNAGIGVIGAFEATPMATVPRSVRDEYLRRDGDDAGVAAAVSGAEIRCGGECDIERDAAFNVHVKLVEPGYAPTTRFTSNGGSRMQGLFPEAYAGFVRPILASFAPVTTVTKESDVSEAVYRAANDASGQLRFPAGSDAVALADNARQFV